jgi:hypothetical protein
LEKVGDHQYPPRSQSLQKKFLIRTYFQRDFIIYSFATKTVVASVLTQRNAKGEEFPISFMSKTLHDYELIYLEFEKQDLSLVKAVAYF